MKNVVRCAIRCHLYNFKNVKKHSWMSVTSSKEPATLLKITLLQGGFSRFLVIEMVPIRTKHLIYRASRIDDLKWTYYVI